MSVWAVPNLVSVLLLAFLLAFVMRRRPPATIFPALLAALITALLFITGDWIADETADPSVHLYGLSLLYAGIMGLGPAWFALAVRFTQHHGEPLRVGRETWMPPLAVPAFGLYVVFLTNPWHGLFITPHIASRSDFHALWWIHAAFQYLLLAATACVHLRLAWRTTDSNVRAQAYVLALGTAFPSLSNAFYIAAPEPPPFDPTVLGVGVSSALFVAAIYRRQLFALSPIAFVEVLRHDSDGVLLIAPDGNIFYANPAARRLFERLDVRPGIAALAVLTRALRDPNDAARPVSLTELEQRLLVRAPASVLYRFGGRGRRWLRIEAAALPAWGKVAGHSLRMRDETALHTAIEAVEDQASVLEATLAAANEALLVTDFDGSIRYFNERWQEMFEFPQALRPGTDVERVREFIESKLTDPAAVERQIAILRRQPMRETLDEFDLQDGRVLECASQPLVREGNTSGRIWRLRDITEQRHSEAAVRHAQKLESLGVMAGGIAHDFNNLLAVVIGNTSLALDEVPGDGLAAACLHDVKKAAERAGELTEQLLAYAGKGAVTFEHLDASQLVRDVADLIAASIPKSVEVNYSLADDLPAVFGDASQIRQIAMNLILNGAEAIGEEGGRIEVASSLAPADSADSPGSLQYGRIEPGSHVLLRVSDTGCGMDESTRARIFDPFFTTKFTGRGLGLAATLGIVRSHHGTLRLESEPGRGSTFTILLPCGAAPLLHTSGEGPAMRPWQGSGTVLVVDDDPEVRMTASRILRSAGLTVLAAEDGLEAVRMYRERGGEIDAVLLDVTMPRMNGEQARRALLDLDPEARIVLSSGYPEREVARQLAGARVPFVRKPYTKQALIDCIRRVLSTGLEEAS